MGDDYLSRLPYCLRAYVEGHRWTDFREVQKKSFDVLFDTGSHLLISSGTSSGKTEAAFFPVISDIYKNRPRRISALYVSPLIALIDDQRDRLSGMLRDSEIDLYSWHGDISSTTKRKVLESGEGILQITPESLENVVNKHYSKIEDMFSDLRYVIIDEVHTFMNSDRGLHLLCELGAIEKIAGCHPRRIGLSATLSDYDEAMKWLSADTGGDVALVDSKEHLDYDLTVTFTRLAPRDDQNRQKTLRSFYTKVFNVTNDYNCLVFTNDRMSVESTVFSLKKINREKGIKKEIWAHHSSISKEYRKIAEERMKDPGYRCTAVATSTLELGIDVGDLERVVHINAPQTVSSFIQKFGRSGRRSGHPVMICCCNNRYNNSLSEDIDMELVKVTAEAALYFKHGWIEPIRYSKLPYSLLFQQTVSYVRSRYTASKNELVRDVLRLHPFSRITEADFACMLDYMCDCEVLDYNSYHDSYSLGSVGEKISRESDFGSNFRSVKEYEVVFDRQKIGTIQDLPNVSSIIQLAGSSWEVVSVDHKHLRVMVKGATKASETHWKSGRADVDTRLMREMYYCLCSDEEYPWLDEEARIAMTGSRNAFRGKGLHNLIIDTDKDLRIYPWLGTIQFDTLYRILFMKKIANVCEAPYSIILKEGTTLSDVESAIADFAQNGDIMDLVEDRDVLRSKSLGKYSEFIPKELLKKQFIEDRLDLDIDLNLT